MNPVERTKKMQPCSKI